jgi:hypothetical protein
MRWVLGVVSPVCINVSSLYPKKKVYPISLTEVCPLLHPDLLMDLKCAPKIHKNQYHQLQLFGRADKRSLARL